MRDVPVEPLFVIWPSGSLAFFGGSPGGGPAVADTGQEVLRPAGVLDQKVVREVLFDHPFEGGVAQRHVENSGLQFGDLFLEGLNVFRFQSPVRLPLRTVARAPDPRESPGGGDALPLVAPAGAALPPPSTTPVSA